MRSGSSSPPPSPATAAARSRAGTAVRKPLSLADFARQLGLSPSTVSKAINGRADVNAQTRARVLAAAAARQFTPDPAGRRLRRQTADTIGFVLSAPQAHFAHPFFLDMLTGIDEALEGTPYQTIIASARSPEREMECFVRLVEQHRVDAVLFARTRRNDPRIAYLLERKVPFVAFGRSESPKAYPCIDIDHTVVGNAGCARFIALGHRRIAQITGPSDLMFTHHQRTGYAQALSQAGLAFDPVLQVEEALTEEGGARAAGILLSTPNPPTAIVCGHDLMALGVMRMIAQRGLRPGLDIGVIGGDNHPIGALIDPPLTSFTAQTREAGHRMVQMLMASLAGTPARQLQEVWVPELIVRSSDGPRRPALANQYRTATAKPKRERSVA